MGFLDDAMDKAKSLIDKEQDLRQDKTGAGDTHP